MEVWSGSNLNKGIEMGEMFIVEIKVVGKEAFGWVWVAKSTDELKIQKIRNRYKKRGIETNIYTGKPKERGFPRGIALPTPGRYYGLSRSIALKSRQSESPQALLSNDK